MHPVLTVLEWQGLRRPIGSYGAMLALALVVGGLLALRRGERMGLDRGALIASLAFGTGVGFACAYLLFSLVTWLTTGSLGPALAQPGLVFYGGALGGALGFTGMARALGLPLGRAADACVPALPIAHALGRVGCFLGGCCHGAPHEGVFAVTYTHPLAPASRLGVSVHPWPLYEAALLLLLACVSATFPRRARPGVRFALYAGAYALVRFGLEPLRGDTVRGLFLGAMLSTSQLVSLLVLALLLALWGRGRLRAPSPGL